MSSVAPYLCIPLSILAMDAPSLNAKVLLADIIGMYKSTGKVFASDDYYAERYNIGKRSIGEAMKWLDDNGWVAREINHKARTKRALIPTEQALSLLEKSMRNPHEVDAESATTPCEIRTDSMQNPQELHAKSADYKNSLIEQSKKEDNTLPVESDPLGFDAFWNAYDKKVDTAKCRRKWDALPVTKKEKALAHIPAYVRARPDKKFRKDPLTYLNGENWNDEELPPADSKPAPVANQTTAPISHAAKLKQQSQHVPL